MFKKEAHKMLNKNYYFLANWPTDIYILIYIKWVSQSVS